MQARFKQQRVAGLPWRIALANQGFRLASLGGPFDGFKKHAIEFRILCPDLVVTNLEYSASAQERS